MFVYERACLTCVSAPVCLKVGALGVDFIATVKVTTMDTPFLQWIWGLHRPSFNRMHDHRGSIFSGETRRVRKPNNVFITAFSLNDH